MMDLELIKSIGLQIGFTAFVIYVTYIWGKYGVQKSISISFYDLPQKERWVFRLFIFTLAGSVMLVGLGWSNPFFFISGSLLSFVGIFSRIKDKKKKKVHMVGAIGGIIFGAIALCTVNLYLGLAAAGLIIIQSGLSYLFAKKENIIWNVEIASFVYLILSLFYIVNY